MAHYVLPQKSINYLISRNYSIGEIWTNLKDNGITYCKVLPIKEPLEMQNCWKAMGFSNTHIQVSISSFSSSESVLASAGLYNSNQWNEVYERIKGNKPTNNGHWKGKPKFATSIDHLYRRDKVKEWKARDKKLNQKKFKNFDDLYSLCSHYHLNYNFVEKQFKNNIDTFCTNSGIVIKKNVMAS